MEIRIHVYANAPCRLTATWSITTSSQLGVRCTRLHMYLADTARDNSFIRRGYRRTGDHESPVEPHAIATGTSVKTPSHATEPASFVNTERHDTFYKCFRSIWCYWHNESVNIHTHLHGALLMIAVLCLEVLDLYGWLPQGPWPVLSMIRFPGHLAHADSLVAAAMSPNTADLAVMTIFYVAAMICLGCSATYHTLACHSQKVAKAYNRVD